MFSLLGILALRMLVGFYEIALASGLVILPAILAFTISFVAEFWGLPDGLMLTRRLDVSKIVIEIDVKFIMDLFNCEGDHGFQFHPCSVIFSDYRSLIQLFEVALFQHTHREGNYCADLLAKTGNSSSTPFFVFYVPLFLL